VYILITMQQVCAYSINKEATVCRNIYQKRNSCVCILITMQQVCAYSINKEAGVCRNIYQKRNNSVYMLITLQQPCVYSINKEARVCRNIHQKRNSSVYMLITLQQLCVYSINKEAPVFNIIHLLCSCFASVSFYLSPTTTQYYSTVSTITPQTKARGLDHTSEAVHYRCLDTELYLHFLYILS
jgi:hypothetical protein